MTARLDAFADVPRRRRRDPLVVVGVIVLLAAVVFGGRWAWETFGTTWQAHRREAATLRDFTAAHPLPPRVGELRTDFNLAPTLRGGDVVGTLWVPAWAGTTGVHGENLDARTPIRRGMSDAVLNSGSAGTFDEAVDPPAVGNFSVGAHRRSYGDNFLHLDELVAGDAVVVETPDAWFVYEVTGASRVVRPDQRAEVLAPAPSGLPSGGRYLTLVTCHSVTRGAWGNDHRIVVHASAIGWLEHDAGVPPQLAVGTR
jgi:sortase A